MTHPITPPTELSVGPARCPGIGSYEDGEWYWREGCYDCYRRITWYGDGWIEPPPIIAFECEYRIGPDKNAAQGYHAPGPEPLSPAAEAIFFAADGMQPRQYRGRALAAAIRALAEQLRLELPLGDTDADAGVFAAHQAIHSVILAIATELEGQ